jgi:hypothetical protein
MKPWPNYPVIYEINTWVWLSELSRNYQKPVNLATVLEQKWDSIASVALTPSGSWASGSGTRPGSRSP